MGLSVAWYLARAGRSVTLYEASGEPGGVSASFELGGVTVDRFYHTILPADTALLRLIEDVGASDRMSWRAVRTGFHQAGRLHSVSTPLELLRFPVLSFPERVRLGLMAFRAQRNTDWLGLRHLTCEEWLTREVGAGVYRKLWRPLLKAKLGSAAPRVSASFLWGTLNRLQSDRKDQPLKRDDRMGFLGGGYQSLLSALIARLLAMGVDIRTNASVTSVRRDGGGWIVNASGEERYGALVSTLPQPILEGILLAGGEPPDPEASRRSIDYLGVVVEVLLLSRTLSPFYILNLGDDDLALTGVIETTNLAPEGYFDGRALVYLPRYVTSDDAFAALSDDDIRSRFHADLRRLFPDFSEREVLASSIQRARFVQPIHTTDYLERQPAVEPRPGLWVASSAQVYPWPLNNDRILRQAGEVAGQLLAVD